MTAKDAFSLSPRQWDEVEEKYRKANGLPAEEMLVHCWRGRALLSSSIWRSGSW